MPATIALGCLALPLAALPAVAAPAPASASVAEGSDWLVERTAGGYLVTLELDEALPMRSASPSLMLDDIDLGPAIESEDGRSLSVLTADPRVVDAESIEVGWDGVAEQQGSSAQSRRMAPSPSAARATDLEVLATDPGEAGEYSVARADYDFGDEAIDLAGIGGIKGEVRGAVYYPQERTTASPLVVFLHGRHASCAGTAPAGSPRWPCAETQTDIPSYLGYSDTAEALASHGYLVVSVSANAINANDAQLTDDRGGLARGQLVLDTLDLLAQANAGEDVGLDPVLAGRIDFDRIGLMGHSRGGEGVIRASLLNLERDDPYEIKALLPLAPTNFAGFTVPEIPTAVILPYCDGDVAALGGQHYVDDSRYAYGDSVLRSAVTMLGSNHNYFNTVWTPQLYPQQAVDDWSYQDRGNSDPTCGYGAPTRLTYDEQRAAGTAYMAGFFRLVLGGEDDLLALFDGSASTVPSAGRADVRVSATMPAEGTASVAKLVDVSDRVVTSGNASAEICASIAANVGRIPNPYPLCGGDLSWYQSPHWGAVTFSPHGALSPMMHMRWTSASGALRITVPAPARDASGYEHLAFKTMPDENVVGSTEMSLTVLDGSGGTQTVAFTETDDALDVLPGTASPLRKAILQSVRIPVDSLDAIDVSDIREIRFTAGTASGGAYLSDIAFTNAGVGGGERTDRPVVRVADSIVEEGSGVGTAGVAVLLSEPSEQPVTAEINALGSLTGTVGIARERLTFQPGEVCKVVDVPLAGNSSAGTRASGQFSVVATGTVNATAGDVFGALRVREDDGVMSAAGVPGESIAPVGVQGDACAEATAEVGELSVVGERLERGQAITVTGSGFRVGEQVALAFHSDPVELATVVSSDGTISIDTTVPSDAEFGAHRFVATGFGSSLVAERAVEVVDPSVVAPTPGDNDSGTPPGDEETAPGNDDSGTPPGDDGTAPGNDDSGTEAGESGAGEVDPAAANSSSLVRTGDGFPAAVAVLAAVLLMAGTGAIVIGRRRRASAG